MSPGLVAPGLVLQGEQLTAEESLERVRGFPLFALFLSLVFFALCHLVWTHQTVAFRGSLVLINISQRRQPSKSIALHCWHQSCS